MQPCVTELQKTLTHTNSHVHSSIEIHTVCTEIPYSDSTAAKRSQKHSRMCLLKLVSTGSTS